MITKMLRSWDISGGTEFPWDTESRAKGPERVIDGGPHGGTSLHTIRVENEEVLPDYVSASMAVDFLKAPERAESPFFLGLGFHKPHVPLIAPNVGGPITTAWMSTRSRAPTWLQPAELPEGTLHARLPSRHERRRA